MLPDALDRIKQYYDMMDLNKNAKNLQQARQETTRVARSPSVSSPEKNQDAKSDNVRSKSINSASLERQYAQIQGATKARSTSKNKGNRSVQPVEVDSVLEGFHQAMANTKNIRKSMVKPSSSQTRITDQSRFVQSFDLLDKQRAPAQLAEPSAAVVHFSQDFDLMRKKFLGM